MKTLSRVKKYEELRKSIDTDQDTQNDTLEAQYAKGLNDINPSLYKRMEIKEEEPYKPEREKKDTLHILESEKTTNNFQNEYLDDFINEVRAYNLKKGTRVCEDTQIDILNQLQNQNRPKRSNYVEDIQDNDSIDIADQVEAIVSEDIAQEVRNLLEELNEDQDQTQDLGNKIGEEDKQVYAQMPIQKTQSIEKESKFENTFANQEVNATSLDQNDTTKETVIPDISSLYQETLNRSSIDQKEEERERLLHEKLIEETQQLRIKLNDHEDTLHEYEENLTDLTDDMEKTHKILNVVLCFLILALLTLIGVIVVWLFKGGGAI